MQLVTDQLQFPLLVTSAPGDSRLFIVEKDGRVRIVKNGNLLARPFLDVTGLTSKGGEQGLLGLALDPQFATNRRFFISYTNTSGNSVLASYTASATNPDSADERSVAIRLTVDQPASNHNGGHIVFGPGGYLYMGLGDGGGSNDQFRNGQDRTDLLGSLLRLDVSGATGYAVPAANPFVGQGGGVLGELWDWGLRNPWRFSFDRANGDLYIADVGQNLVEEVNVATAASGGGRGLNYGWPIMEGLSCFNAATCNQTGLTLPVLDYTHSDGCSVTGGYVYRGTALPSLQGTYFYSDFCSGWIRSFRYASGQATEPASWPDLEPGGNVPSFGEDADGELYVMSSGGEVYKIVPR